MPNKYLSRIALLSIIILSFVSSADAAVLRIVDCNGHTKALREIEPAGETSVKISVVTGTGAAATGESLKLMHPDGTVLRAVSKDGVADFGSVGPGTWVVAAEDGNVFFSSIVLGGPIVAGPWWSFGTGSVLEDIAIVAGVVTAGVVAAVAVDHFDGGGGGSSSGNSPDPGASPTCPACNPDANAPSVPGF